jgi:replicative DNA helicase
MMATVHTLPVQQRPATPAQATPSMPHDAAVEAAVLDALINAPVSMAERAETLAALTTEHFHVEANRLVFPVVRDLVGADVPIDAVTVAAKLRETPPPDVPDGWVGYLSVVICDQGGVTAAARRQHTTILDNLRRCREVIRTCAETMARAAQAPDAVGLIEQARTSLAGIAVTKTGTARPLADIANDVFQRIACTDVRPRTGYPSFDRAVGRLLGGQVTVIAARPKAGKTNLAWHIAEKIAMGTPGEDGFPEAVFFVTAEMSAEALYMRQLGIRARVPPDAIQDGALHDSQWQKLTDANRDWANIPVMLDDFGSASPTPAKIEAAFLRDREMLAAGTYRNKFGYTYPRCKMRVMIVDHLGKIASPKDSDPRAGDPQRLKASMEAIVQVAKRTDSHVVLLWHAGMRDKDPTADLTPADVRGTSDAEGSCDRMIFLTRPEPNRIKLVHYVDRHRAAAGYESPIWLEVEDGVIWEAAV